MQLMEGTNILDMVVEKCSFLCLMRIVSDELNHSVCVKELGHGTVNVGAGYGVESV